MKSLLAATAASLFLVAAPAFAQTAAAPAASQDDPVKTTLMNLGAENAVLQAQLSLDQKKIADLQGEIAKMAIKSKIAADKKAAPAPKADAAPKAAATPDAKAAAR